MAPKRKKTLRKTPSKNSSLSLYQIEELLGEDFETLAEAQRELRRSVAKLFPKQKNKPEQKQKSKPEQKRKALPKRVQQKGGVYGASQLPEVKRVTKGAKPTTQKGESNVSGAGAGKGKPAPLSKPKLNKKQNSFTIKELKGSQKETVRKGVQDFLNDQSSADNLTRNVLKPGEYIGIEVPHKYTGTDLKVHKGYARSYSLYSNFGQVFKRISSYLTYGKFGRYGTQQSRATFIENIKIVKFGGPLSKAATQAQQIANAEDAGKRWSTLKREEKTEREERKKVIKKRVSDLEKRVRQLEKELKKGRKKK